MYGNLVQNDKAFFDMRQHLSNSVGAIKGLKFGTQPLATFNQIHSPSVLLTQVHLLPKPHHTSECGYEPHCLEPNCIYPHPP